MKLRGSKSKTKKTIDTSNNTHNQFTLRSPLELYNMFGRKKGEKPLTQEEFDKMNGINRKRED